MKLLFSPFTIIRLLAICALGGTAALCGWERIDDWCTRQLLDTDGQPEDQRDAGPNSNI